MQICNDRVKSSKSFIMTDQKVRYKKGAEMKTDIQIAQEAAMKPITEVAEKLGSSFDELELYGKYKAKITDEYLNRIKDKPNGKLVLVTAINPRPAGE